MKTDKENGQEWKEIVSNITYGQIERKLVSQSVGGLKKKTMGAKRASDQVSLITLHAKIVYTQKLQSGQQVKQLSNEEKVIVSMHFLLDLLLAKITRKSRKHWVPSFFFLFSILNVLSLHLTGPLSRISGEILSKFFFTFFSISFSLFKLLFS